MNTRWISGLFIVAGIYEGLLGLAFLLFSAQIFQRLNLPAPHLAYIHFPALLLVLFALMFFQTASNPVRYRDLIPYGMGLQAACAGTVFWYQLQHGVAAFWLPWAWAAVALLVLFALAWRSLKSVAQLGRGFLTGRSH